MKEEHEILAHSIRVGKSLPNANSEVTGGLIIGGAGPGSDGVILKGGGNPAWPKFKATRLGSPTQLQIYPNVVQFSAWASSHDMLTATGGTDLNIPDLYVNDSIWWDGECYRVAEKISARTIRLKKRNGDSPAFQSSPDQTSAQSSKRVHTGYHIYHHARGVCNVINGQVLRVSGDVFHRDHDVSIVVDGVMYRDGFDGVRIRRDNGNRLNVTGTSIPDASNVSYVYRGRPPTGAAYVTLLRLQGRYGDSEEVAAHVITPERRYMVETQFAGDGEYMPIVFRTGPRDDWFSENKDFSSSRVAATIDSSGNFIIGNGFRSSSSPARLSVVDDINTSVRNDPNGSKRHDLFSMTSRYHRDNTNRRLVMGTFNDFVGPFMQAEDEDCMPMGMQLQPTRGKHSKVFIGKKNAPFPDAKLIVGDGLDDNPIHQSAIAPSVQGKYDLGHPSFGFRSIYLDGGILVTSCEGSPEGIIAAPPGSLCVRRGHGTGSRVFVKQSGTQTTGWVSVT